MNNNIEVWARSQRLKFSGFENTLAWATSRAYADLRRRLSGYGKVTKRDVQIHAQEELKSSIENYFKNPKTDEKQFDEWHKKLVDRLIKIYMEADDEYYSQSDGRIIFDKSQFTVGIAQKWINMSFKYIYSFVDIWKNDGDLHMQLDDFNACHVPLDSYVIRNAADLKDGTRYIFSGWDEEKTRWSQLSGYESYLGMQEDLRKFARDNGFSRPLDVEALLWVEPNAEVDGKRIRDSRLDDFREATNALRTFHYRKKGEKKNH